MRIKLRTFQKIDQFTALFAVSLLFIMLDQCDLLPMADTLRKFKYIYIVVVGIKCFRIIRFYYSARYSIAALIAFFTHSLLFGLVFVNKSVDAAIKEHMQMMLTYLAFCTMTFFYVMHHKMFRKFLETCFFVSGFQLALSVLTHFGDLVNPIWGIIQTFRATGRYRTTFGYIHAGYSANAGFCLIILSLLMWEIHKRDHQKKKEYIAWIVAFVGIAVEVMISSAERSLLISSLMVFLFYYLFTKINLLHKNWFKVCVPVIAFVLLFLLIASGLWNTIWNASNRSLNISVNYPVFKQLGNIWTGMGAVGSNGFQKETSVFGIQTSSLDMYYVYLYFTTGIIGCLIQGLGLLIIFFRLYHNSKDTLGVAFLGSYVAMLFLAIWQPSLFTYRYPSCIILLVLMLIGICDDRCDSNVDEALEL